MRASYASCIDSGWLYSQSRPGHRSDIKNRTHRTVYLLPSPLHALDQGVPYRCVPPLYAISGFAVWSSARSSYSRVRQLFDLFWVLGVITEAGYVLCPLVVASPTSSAKFSIASSACARKSRSSGEPQKVAWLIEIEIQWKRLARSFFLRWFVILVMRRTGRRSPIVRSARVYFFGHLLESGPEDLIERSDQGVPFSASSQRCADTTQHRFDVEAIIANA